MICFIKNKRNAVNKKIQLKQILDALRFFKIFYLNFKGKDIEKP